jgi:hypothetical protein
VADRERSFGPIVQTTELSDDAMSGQSTTSQGSPKEPTPVALRDGRSFVRWFLPALIFLCGCLVGAGATVTLIEHRLFSIMRQPAPDPERLVRQLKSEPDLDADQSQKIEAIVQTHDAEMREMHARADARRNRFEADIAAVLNESQKTRWHERCERLRALFPSPPL